MVKIRFYLDCRGVEKGSVAPLKLCIYKDNVRALIPLNINIHPKDWSAKRQRPADEELYNLLSERKLRVESFVLKQETDGAFKGMKSCEVKNLIVEEFFSDKKIELPEIPPNNFKMRYEEFSKTRPAEGTRNLYDRTWIQIEKYALEEKIDLPHLTFEDITVKWLRDFDTFLSKTSPARNARNIHFRNIRAVFNDALDDEVISCYPFRKFKLKNEETVKRNLSVENLRLIFNCKVEKYAELYQDMFKLTFFLIGINPVDLAHLNGITSDGRIEYQRAKTHRKYSLKVEPEAKAIIEKWRGEKYLLSILDRWKDYKNFSRQMNIALQCMGMKRTGLGGKKDDKNKLFPDLTIYWARHTWATIARKIGISKDDIKLSLGHGSKTVTDIYIDEDLEKIDEANRRVMDWVLYGKK
ncbi:MAG: site-specific integrase [Muribaculaceae bacterium]|nr:site-specific integrase [Muribaculaceae bacterium]